MTPAMPAVSRSEPRWLYLHGFASGPGSAKGRAISAHFAALGQPVELLDLRIPSLERLRLSAMIDHVRSSIGAAEERAVLFGSSLGGLAAARVAERDARVSALVLLAPAFRFAERWRRRLGDEAWRRWEESGWLEIDDHASGVRARVDFEFVEDAARLDAEGGGWPDVRVPTLIVHGVADDVVDVELSREFSRGRRHVRLVEVDDGHELGRSLERIVREAGVHLAGYLAKSSRS